MKKLAVLTNELPPYRRPIFNKLGRQEGLDVTIYLNTRAEPHRMWSPVGELPHVEIETVPGFAISSPQPYSERVVYIPIGVLSALFRKRPDAVISGEFGFRTLMAWAYCALFRKPLIIWQGETEHSAASISNLQRRARQFLARRAAGFLAYGQAARRYLHSLNVDDHKISVLTQSVDNDYWIQAARRADPAAVRQAHHLTGRVALFIGHLHPRKGAHHLIDAWAALPPALQAENSLLLVGDGSERKRLKAQVARLKAQNVVFAGAVPYNELAAYYAAADFFVFPTLLDVWGLVVNEAMASGLPVLCSRYAGCAEELIIPGQTGEVFDPTDTQTLRDLLARWLQTPYTTPDPAIQAHIQHWDFERSVSGILEQLTRVGVLSHPQSIQADPHEP